MAVLVEDHPVVAAARVAVLATVLMAAEFLVVLEEQPQAGMAAMAEVQRLEVQATFLAALAVVVRRGVPASGRAVKAHAAR